MAKERKTPPLFGADGVEYKPLEIEAAADPEAEQVYQDTMRRIELLEEGRRIRHGSRIAQKDVAAAMGTTQSAVSDIEKGRVDPQLQTIQRYARAIGRRLDFVFATRETPPMKSESSESVIAEMGGLALGPLLTALARQTKHEPASTESISRAIPLSKFWTQTILERLEDRGAVRSAEVGRRRVYSLDYEAANLIGVSIERERAVAVLVDMGGQHRHTLTAELSDTTSESVIDIVANLATALYQWSERPLLGVGVCLAGMVDARGTVQFAPELQTQDDLWDNIDLEDRLKKAIEAKTGSHKTSVVVENDANALAVFEYLRRERVGESVVTLLISNTGTGAGVIVDGYLIRGAHSAAGEGGHTIVDPKGPKCRAGLTHRGCLETVASLRSILHQLEMRVDSPDAFNDAIRQANERIACHDDQVIDAFENAGKYHGQFLSTVILLLDPARIVIYGDSHLSDAKKYASAREFHRGIRSALAEAAASRKHLVGETPLEWMPLAGPAGRDARAVAAAAAAFWHFLKRPMRLSYSRPMHSLWSAVTADDKVLV